MTVSQRIGLFFLNVTQRIPFVKYDSNGTFFQIWHKELNFFWVWLKELNFFSSNMTQRIENPSFLEYDASTWTFFSKYDAKNWTIFENSFDMTQRFELILLIWLKELNSFLTGLEELGSFFNTTQRIEPFLEIRLKVLFLWKNWLKELNSFFFGYDSKNWTLFSDMTQRIEPIFNTTRSIEFFKQKLWLKEFNFYLVKKHDSKNWTFFLVTKKVFFLKSSKNWTFLNVTRRIETVSLCL